MMKLRHLFDNRDLAVMLLGYWDRDADRLDVLDRFRISSNAVYPFLYGGELRFLRFAPLTEKDPSEVAAELAFLAALRKTGYPAAQTVPARNGRELVTAQTPWGGYLAVVFAAAPGLRLDTLPYTAGLYEGYGRALGQLHRQSASLPGHFARPDWRQRLNWAEAVLRDYQAPAKALTEAALLRAWLGKLPAGADSYGLIHYDFELDNVFWNEKTGVYTPIDFDDCLYHWYAMDVAQVLGSIADELPEHSAEAGTHFLRGYREEWPLDRAWEARLPAFQRYANLFGYARLLRSTAECWQNEPQWMEGLRRHLGDSMGRRAALFAQGLE